MRWIASKNRFKTSNKPDERHRQTGQTGHYQRPVGRRQEYDLPAGGPAARSDSERLGNDAAERRRGDRRQGLFFLSPQEFKQRLAQNEFLEYADVFGNYYGTPREPVEKAMAEGRVVILEIDVQGAMQVKAKMPEAVMIFILPPGTEELLKRLEARARGEDEAGSKKTAGQGRGGNRDRPAAYDYFVVNEVLDKAVQEVITIIQGHENH